MSRPAAGLRFGSDLSGYRKAVDDALSDPVDRWGEEILSLADGPSFEAVVDYLVPLAHGDAGYHTESGIHYIPMTEPYDADSYALHVADGSQIIAEYTNLWGAPEWALPFPRPERGGPDVLCFDFLLGDDGDERFGQDLARLGEPSLGEGWLPILTVEYTDRRGLRLRRESFATRAPDTGQLTSYVRFDILESSAAEMDCSLTVRVRGNAGYANGPVDYRYPLSPQPASVYLSCANAACATPVRLISAAEYDRAQRASATYWRTVLADGAQVSVPDQRVTNATRNLIVQNLVMGERYSLGNPYETVFSMEAHEAVMALDRFGFHDRAEQCLDRLVEITNGPGPEWYESWERGAKLMGAAEHYRLTGNAAFIRRHADTYLEYLYDMRRQLRTDPHGLLSPERYAWDIPEHVYGWHSQSVAWRGMRDIVAVLVEVGVLTDEEEFAGDLARFAQSLRAAAASSATTLADGSVFVPVALFSDEPVHSHLTESRAANYWNLVAPYALASGIVEPRSSLATGLLRYMRSHGAWLIGLTRYNGLYDPPTPIGTWREDGNGGYKSPGIDNAFGVRTLFFLADNDQSDRLALALYAKLAHGMTRGTYIDGETTTIGVCDGEFFRTSWNPPNSTSNALFLDALRLLLLRESHDDHGRAALIDLAWATPRHWLEHGKQIVVSELPSLAGPVSYRITSAVAEGYLLAEVTLPAGEPPAQLHVRLPHGYVVQRVESDDGRTLHWSAEQETIKIDGTRSLRVSVTPRREAGDREDVEIRGDE